MFKKVITSFAMALANIRANFLHTLLSILGIVIGVAALVGILSLIDGMEKFAQDQITETTDLKRVAVHTQTHKQVNGLRVRKDTFPVLDYASFQTLLKGAAPGRPAALEVSMPSEISLPQRSTAALIYAMMRTQWSDTVVSRGRLFAEEDIIQGAPVAVVNALLAREIAAPDSLEEALGRSFSFRGRSVTVVGVLKPRPKEETPMAAVPITLLTAAELQASPPDAWIEAPSVEDVPDLKARLENGLQQQYGENSKDFEVFTNDFRVKQAARAFLLFRIVMGMIVGISVVVGGIGVMNVLLISVTERTPEIGLRKALGATRRDIMRQFLSESITIAAFGSLLGLIVGILATMLFVPIIKALTEVPFQAAYTWNTLLVIGIVAVLVGLIFGTYPAMKASRLDPVEAIRRE